MACSCATCPAGTTLSRTYSCAEFAAMTGIAPPPGSCCYECVSAPGGECGSGGCPVELYCPGGDDQTGLLIGAFVVGAGIFALLASRRR